MAVVSQSMMSRSPHELNQKCREAILFPIETKYCYSFTIDTMVDGDN